MFALSDCLGGAKAMRVNIFHGCIDYPSRQSRSSWVGCSAQSVCLSVCLQNLTQKTKDPKCSNLVGNDLGIS